MFRSVYNLYFGVLSMEGLKGQWPELIKNLWPINCGALSICAGISLLAMCDLLSGVLLRFGHFMRGKTSYQHMHQAMAIKSQR